MRNKRGSALVLLFACLLLVASCQGYRHTRRTLVAKPDLSRIADGVYEGVSTAQDSEYGAYKVAVQIKDHIITDIRVIERPDSDVALEAEELLPRILSGQTTEVDAVSGATAASEALLEAVENALAGAGEGG